MYPGAGGGAGGTWPPHTPYGVPPPTAEYPHPGAPMFYAPPQPGFPMMAGPPPPFGLLPQTQISRPPILSSLPLPLSSPGPAPIPIPSPSSTTTVQSVPPRVIKPGEASPATTVFVGKITAEVSDDLIRRVLASCGEVMMWKRVSPTFGFCTYGVLSAVMTAQRVLNGYPLKNQALVITADEKTKQAIEDYEKKLRAEGNSKALDDALRAQDESIKRILEDVINKDSTRKLDLINTAELFVDDMTGSTADKEKVGLVTSEILKFREQQLLEKTKVKEKINVEKEEEKQRRLNEQEIRRLRDARLRELNRESKRTRGMHADLAEKERVIERVERSREQDPNYDFDLRLKQRLLDRAKDIEKEISSEDFLKRRVYDDRRMRDRRRERDQDIFDSDSLRRSSLSSSSSSSSPSHVPSDLSSPKGSEGTPGTKQTTSSSDNLSNSGQENDSIDSGRRSISSQQIGFSLGKTSGTKRPRPTSMAPLTSSGSGPSSSMFQQHTDDDDEESLTQLAKKHRTLQSLQELEHEEAILSQIPSDPKLLYAFPIDWDFFELNKKKVVEKLRPWVSSKIVEYLDMEEEDLVDFVIQSICDRSTPASIKAQIDVVLDKESENFIHQLWRLFIFHLLALKHRPQ